MLILGDLFLFVLEAMAVERFFFSVLIVLSAELCVLVEELKKRGVSFRSTLEK